MMGNYYLLSYPDKMLVLVHHDDDDATFNAKCQQWMSCGARGGVLVSAGIAPREAQVMREAGNRGYKMIKIRENGFEPLYKPGGQDFDACAAGRLLLICPWDYHRDRRRIRREQCLELNRLAAAIAAGPIGEGLHEPR